MKRIILLLITVIVVMLSSCGDRVKTRTYKVKVIKTGVNLIVTADEPMSSYTFIYSKGDTVMIDHNYEIAKGRTKCVVVNYL